MATEWQRQIDQAQPESINLAQRLNVVSGCNEIVVSNTCHQRLPRPFALTFRSGLRWR